MSKIGKKPIMLPTNVHVEIVGDVVRVKGPKGELSQSLVPGVHVLVHDGYVSIQVENEEKKNLWGLYRTLVANMITGVTSGYEKKLQIVGIGYGAVVQGSTIILSLGFTHKIHFPIPHGIHASTEQDTKGNTILTISGISKYLVGQIAADIRALKKPDPYKGKGIRYLGEEIKLKPGKAATK